MSVLLMLNQLIWTLIVQQDREKKKPVKAFQTLAVAQEPNESIKRGSLNILINLLFLRLWLFLKLYF